MSSPIRLRRHPAFRAVLGVSLSSAVAAVLSFLIRDHADAGNWLPILFVVVVLIVAELFGSVAGILSSLVAAVVFARWLYAPHGDLAVQSVAARASLGWMILAGTSLSFLLAPADTSEPGKHR
jgi:K+-sensing histidine kinase KdpD